MEEIDYDTNMLDNKSDDESMDTQETAESASDSQTSASSKPPETFLDPNERVPSTYFYKKESKRPTINELREKSKHSKHKKAPPVDATKKNMGTFTGVYLPVIVNLVGMTFWVRAGKLVGDCGVVYSLLIIWISAIISIILISTLSALGTNGEMDSGGIYFVISRSIGPELGRCLTIFLDVSTCLAAAAIVVGFAETIVSVYEPKYITGKAINDVRLLAFAIMFISIPLSFRWTQSLRITSCTHLMGLLSFFIGCFMHKPYTVQGFVGPSVENFKVNAFEPMTVSKFFGYIYTVSPAFTSLTGCLSYAGCIKRPQKMIPNGLIFAFATSLLIWHVTIILLGLCGDKQFLQDNTISPIIAFGINKWIGFTTIIVFGMHRSLGNIGYEIGLITDMAKDKLLPKIRWCYDYWVPLSITSIFIGIGSLDFTSNINTIFWLTMGVVFNWCVWSASRSHIPGWRPKSKLYCPWLSLIGTFLTLLLCIMISWWNTIINWVIFGIIYWISLWKGSDKNWGSLIQAKAFYNAFSHALKTQRIEFNPKIFRINLLTVVGESERIEETSLPFIDIVLGGEGFCIVSQVINESNGLNVALEQRKQMEKFFAHHHNIFYETVMASSSTDALTRQMLTSGVGAFRPNTVFLNIDGRSSSEVHEMTMEILKAKYGLILATRPHDINNISNYIDIYWLSDEGGLTVLAGYIIAKTMNKKIRIITVAYTGNGDTVEESVSRTKKLCEKFRIECEVVGMELSEKKKKPSAFSIAYWENMTLKSAYDHAFTRFLLFSDMIREFSSSSCLVISTLFVPTDDMDAQIYCDILKLIANIPPAFCFVRGNGENVLSWKA